MLLLEDGHCLRDQALSVCRERGAREAEGVRAGGLSTLAQMVEGGLGVTLLPASAAASKAAAASACSASARPSRAAPWACVWRKASPRGDEFRSLGELLRRSVGRGPGAMLHPAP